MTTAVRRSGPGFTLIEVMAVVFLTALVLGVALNYYSNLTNASQRALARTREVRRAIAILDRVAKDLQTATLVMKPIGADRLSHAWIFLAENGGSAETGSDRVKFATRDYRPKRRSKNRHEPDRAMVTYITEEDENGRLTLRRGISTHWPEGLDREFPFLEETLLLTDELDSFSLTFLDEAGNWQDQWDSSQLVQADRLPVAVLIEIALAESLSFADEQVEDPSFEFGEDASATFRRTVVLPMRPLDLALLTEPNRGGGGGSSAGEDDGDSGDERSDEEGGCRSVLECFDIDAAQADVDAGGSTGAANIDAYWNDTNIAQSCFSDYRNLISANFIRPSCL